MNTTALTDFFLSVFFAFLFFGHFAVSGFLGGLFWEECKNKKQIENKTKNRKRRRTTRCKQEDHLVLWQKQQHRNNIIQMNSINGNKQHKENKQEQIIKHRKQTTLLSIITQKKHQNCRENSFFFIDWKQNKQQDKSQNTNEKQQNTKNKANIETERLKHTPWKQTNKNNRRKQNKLSIMKATWVLKRGC